jgi:hypothetical protein
MIIGLYRPFSVKAVYDRYTYRSDEANCDDGSKDRDSAGLQHGRFRSEGGSNSITSPQPDCGIL